MPKPKLQVLEKTINELKTDMEKLKKYFIILKTLLAQITIS